MKNYDVIIIGGGPAGLNAALVLGRCRRSVLVFDSNQRRNAVAHAMHGFLSRDGLPPPELLRIGREQLKPYGVEVIDTEIINAAQKEGIFAVTTAEGAIFKSRKLLLATGIIDNLPEVEGFEEMYGISAFHCPYCDGWENQDQRIVAYAKGKEVADYALTLRPYSADLILCTDGPCDLDGDQKARLVRNGIPLIEKPIGRFQASEGQLTHVVFADGDAIERDRLFFHLGQKQRSQLAARLGCKVSDQEGIQADSRSSTDIPGLFSAGDATRDVQQVIVAAAEGAKAAFAINIELRNEDHM